MESTEIAQMFRSGWPFQTPEHVSESCRTSGVIGWLENPALLMCHVDQIKGVDNVGAVAPPCKGVQNHVCAVATMQYNSFKELG